MINISQEEAERLAIECLTHGDAFVRITYDEKEDQFKFVPIPRERVYYQGDNR